MRTVYEDEKMVPTRQITFRSDGYADEAIEAIKKNALLNDGLRLTTSAVIRKALICLQREMAQA